MLQLRIEVGAGVKPAIAPIEEKMAVADLSGIAGVDRRVRVLLTIVLRRRGSRVKVSQAADVTSLKAVLHSLVRPACCWTAQAVKRALGTDRLGRGPGVVRHRVRRRAVRTRKPPVSAFRPGYSRGSSTKVVPEVVEAQANEYGAQATTIRGVRTPSSGFWRAGRVARRPIFDN